LPQEPRFADEQKEAGSWAAFSPEF